MRATAPAERTSTASPCPTSHAATTQSRGAVSGPITGPLTAAPATPSPVISATTTAAARRDASAAGPGRGGTISSATQAPRAASAAAPTGPSHHGSDARGRLAKVSAVAATHEAGSHAIHASASARGGANASRHDAVPSSVAIGAAGPASTLATTPYSATSGANSTMMGPHTSWADSGTASASARGPGIHRDSPSASGAARVRRAPVAAAESRKPKLVASHGSVTSSTATAHESTAMPPPARPSSSAIIATPAMAEARMTLGSGVTSTTNPARAIDAAATRAPRPAPHQAAAPNAMPTMSAQFAPDTAVR